MDIRYINNDFQFLLRVSALIYNEDKSKILILINELEESIDAIKREIKEELGWDNIDYKFSGVCEEIVNFKGYDNHQIDLIYKGVYKEKIEDFEFKGIEGNWINFKWIDIDDIDQYNIYPNIVKEMVKDKTDKIYHSISNEIK